MDCAGFQRRIQDVRAAVQGLSRVPEVAESGWTPWDDDEFRRLLDEIESAGAGPDSAKAEWLAEFTQIDDLGPMGRSMFLSQAALAALAMMPREAYEAGLALHRGLAADAGSYRKIGVCLVLEASCCGSALDIVGAYLSDEDPRVRAVAGRALERMRRALERQMGL